MSNFQNIIGNQLAQAAITGTLATVYTVPANTRTYVKDINICNTTGSAITVNIYLVPSANVAGTGNALLYGYSVAANSIYHWTGTQIMLAAGFISVSASTTGATVTISGGEAT